jgi:predicted DNA-binding protein
MKKEITIPKELHTKLKTTSASKQRPLSEYARELLEKALTMQTVEEKFLETYDFLSKENVEEIVDMIFEGNELAEIVESKFEIINKK